MSRLCVPLVLIALVGCANELPRVTIDTPTSSSVLYADLEIDVEASVSDENHELSDLIVRWSSDLDGAVTGPEDIDESGTIAGELNLGPGLHVLTLEVEDPGEGIGSATVAVDVAATNTPPSCRILGPADGAFSQSGSPVEIEVQAGDVDVGAEALTLSLSSDLDGDLGAPTVGSDGLGSVSSTLSDGTHQLTVTATDELGAGCDHRVLYTVGNPPSVEITNPTTGFVEDVGQPISLQGLVSDDVDAASDLDLRWSSDATGAFGASTADSSGVVRLDTDSLARGPHVITLRATDSLGMYSEASVELLVNGPPTAPVVGIAEGPATDEPLIVEITEASSDIEEDDLTTNYAWYQDDVLVPDLTEASVPAERTARDQVWRVEVWANDGRLDGERGVAGTTVINTAPVIASVSLSPSAPMTNDVVMAVVEASDLDEDAISFAYEWSVNGAVVTGATEASLDGATYFDKGDTVSVTVTPSDDGVTGTLLASTVITAINTPPSEPELEIDPGYTFGDKDASCLVVEDSVDPDGDTVTYTVTWDGDGTAYPSGFTGADGPETLEETDDTVPKEDQDLADTFTCSVTASDGTATTSPVTESFDIADYLYDVGYWREFPYTGILARNYLLGHPVTVPRDMTVVELGIISKRTSSNGRIGLYNESSGKPTSLVVGSGLQRISAGNNEFSVKPTKIKAGTYWIMAAYDSTAYAGEDRGRHTVYYIAYSPYSPLPSSITGVRSYSGYRHNYYLTGYE